MGTTTLGHIPKFSPFAAVRKYDALVRAKGGTMQSSGSGRPNIRSSRLASNWNTNALYRRRAVADSRNRRVEFGAGVAYFNKVAARGGLKTFAGRDAGIQTRFERPAFAAGWNAASRGIGGRNGSQIRNFLKLPNGKLAGARKGRAPGSVGRFKRV